MLKIVHSNYMLHSEVSGFFTQFSATASPNKSGITVMLAFSEKKQRNKTVTEINKPLIFPRKEAERNKGTLTLM